MIATVWQLKWWLVAVGPNIIASVIGFLVGALAARLKYGGRIREHERKVHELHRAIVRDQGPLDD